MTQPFDMTVLSPIDAVNDNGRNVELQTGDVVQYLSGDAGDEFVRVKFQGAVLTVRQEFLCDCGKGDLCPAGGRGFTREKFGTLVQ